MSHYLYASRDDAIQALQAYYPADLVSKFLVGSDEEGYRLDQRILMEHVRLLQQQIKNDEVA